MALHPNLRDLAPLVGTWTGRGHGEYPTISEFDYRDEVTFTDVGKPFLIYAQRTWIGEAPMHVETGYLRGVGDGRVEVCVAIPTGQTENGVGTWEVTTDEDGTDLLVIETDAAVACTPTAKPVDRITRVLECAGDHLTYEMSMSAVGRGLTLHLRSSLTRA